VNQVQTGVFVISPSTVSVDKIVHIFLDLKHLEIANVRLSNSFPLAFEGIKALKSFAMSLKSTISEP